MNFIFQDKEEINTDLNRELVIVINSDTFKKIILNFPENRFNNFQEKYLKFINKINGIEKTHPDNYKYIISNEEDYKIYEEFFLTFY